ncbi:MAG: hypothetical protein HY820_42185 [Acidobacteria bacterium]|nr:hypothetical protein [Acidobacteriota bacterium]
MKVPSEIASYLTTLQAQQVFVTSLDRNTARVYTIPAWNRNVAILTAGDKVAWGKDILFLANEMGQDAEIDGQSRILLPSNLRRLLKLESSQVWLEAYDGVINVYSQAEFEKRQTKAMENLADKLAYMENQGLK